MASRRRGLESVADMARSMGVVLAVVALVVLITIRTKGEAIRTVDVVGMYSQAKIGGTPFPLVRPVGLSAQWRPTSVYFNPPEATGVRGVSLWHIGYVTPLDQYAGMEQSNGSAPDALSAAMTSPEPVGSTEVAGGSWQQFSGDSGKRRALVRTAGAVTVVVDGTATWTELEELAGSLSAT